MSSTVQARDVTEGMVLERLGYNERDRPTYVTARVVKIEDSPIASDSDTGEACKFITWSDGHKATYGATDRFIRRNT